MFNLLKALLLAVLAFALTGCGQDPQETNEEELSQTEGDQSPQQTDQVDKDDLASKLAEWSDAQQEFLNAYGEKDGVRRSPSGVLYTVLQEGDGDSPNSGDIVTVHYEGKLVDGSVFDSSYQRGEPASFPSDRLIPGWVEILPMMHVGDKWEIAIPSELAYGSRGAGGRIPPNSALVFTLELLDFEPKS